MSQNSNYNESGYKIYLSINNNILKLLLLIIFINSLMFVVKMN